MSASTKTALVDALAEKLQDDNDMTPCLLIDPMLREPFPGEWLEQFDLEIEPLPVRHPSLTDDKRPKLIRLRKLDGALLEASVNVALGEQADPGAEQFGGFTIGGWLMSSGPLSRLASQLARCMQAAAPLRAGRRLVRWPDRRVLEWMWPLLRQNQRAHLLGSAVVWYSLDRRNELVAYRRPAAQADGRLRLDSGQWAHAQDCQTAQDLVRGWRRFRTELPAHYLQRVKHAMQSIKDLQVIERSDQVLLGAYILQIHPRLTEHPTLVAAVRHAADDRIPLADVLAEIPDPEGWDKMRTDLGWPTTFSNQPSKENHDHG